MLYLNKMKFWKVIDWISGISGAVLVFSILFVPISMLAKYADLLFVFIIILIFVSLVHSLYVFVKETPKRKWGKPKKQDEDTRRFLNLRIKTWKTIGEWAGIIIILFIIWQFKQGSIGSRDCPDIVTGNQESQIVLQYFYSPFCPACWKGEQIVQNLVEKYPKIRIENYDVRYCKSLMWSAGIRGSPAYHVRSANASDTAYGIDASVIEKQLCGVAGCA